MKKFLFIGLLLAINHGVFAQGVLNLNNIFNSGSGPNATTGGLFWIDNDDSGPNAPALINIDFNVSFYGGSEAGNLALLKTFVNSGGGAVAGSGTFFDLSGDSFPIPGTSTNGFFRIEAWLGATTFANASFRNEHSFNTVFSNPLGDLRALPPATPTDLTGMPAIVLVPVPEPSIFALAGFGAAAMLIFRRQK
jgi:hypothetical protein